MTTILGFKADYSNGKSVDWVQVAPRGSDVDKVQTWHRVSDLKPREDTDGSYADNPHYQDILARWEQVSSAYDAWKAGEEIPENGIPLEAWAGVTAEQATLLKRMHIRTVEDVSGMGEREVAALPFPNARKLPGLAKAYIENQSSSEKDRMIAEMQERMAAMEELLLAKSEEKPRRGRPPKVEAEE